MRVFLAGLIACWGFSCARGAGSVQPDVKADQAVSASVAPGAAPVAHAAFQSVRFEEPACELVPMEERIQGGCLCAWGHRCVCRYRVAPLDAGCLVEYDTERAEGEQRARAKDGSVVVPIGVLVEPGLSLRTKEMKPGEKGTICGAEITCR